MEVNFPISNPLESLNHIRFASCIKYTDIQRRVDKLGMLFVESQKIHLRIHDNLEMTAKFNINGAEEEKRVVKRWYALYTHESVNVWFKGDYVQGIFYYLEGSSPVRVTTLHENGTMEVMYIGSLLDKRCEILNCQYEFIQPVGSTMRKEVIDAEGWALISIVSSPSLGGYDGVSVKFDSKLICSL
ncbi:hypothetical protein LOTGIDRAFT_228361 [Lottia gigantea]|uniref:Uncharacterized protein n=1 Tax=Lottia gigantea TaxID=225164 RepID=V4ASF3_LOTGI|nr:hypothetical protein LOTGIDRAFT_228361 [Lottia gigantea]ESO97800.1 hypothetical protein LOTGIDRAFT_228361 [Lottia gigantea]